MGGNDRREIFLQPQAPSGARSWSPAEPAGQASEPASPRKRLFAFSRDRLPLAGPAVALGLLSDLLFSA